MDEYLIQMGQPLFDDPFGITSDFYQPSGELDGFTPYPTDQHSCVDVSFYDERINDAHKSLVDASQDIVNAQSMDDINRAIEYSKQAQADIDYWNHCRTQSECSQTIDNIRTDQIINDCNKALNDLHNTLNSIPQRGYTDYSNDIFVQGMDWDKIAQQTFGNL